MTLEEAFPGNVGTDTPEAYRRVAREGGVYDLDQYAYDAEGIAGIFEVHAFSFGPRRVSVFFRDVTEKRKAELALREANEMLAVAQRAAKAGFWSWDVPTGVLTWTPEFFELFGLPPDAPASFDTWRAALHPDDVEAAEARIMEAMDDHLVLENEYRVVLPDGSHALDRRRRHDHLRRRRRASCAWPASASTSTSASAATRRSRRSMRSSSRGSKSGRESSPSPTASSRTSSTPSHTTCARRSARWTGSARCCSRTAPRCSPRRTSATCVASARRPSTWPSSSTLCSRSPASGAGRSPCERVDLSAATWAIVDALREADPDRRVSVAVEEGLEARTDAALADIVLSNLLGNAWKFTARGDEARIEVGSMRVNGGGVAFYVRDDGAGFDQEHAADIFRPFHRLHTQEEFPGTGIGLATVQRALDKLGGSCRAEGEPGKGATFFFTLG